METWRQFISRNEKGAVVTIGGLTLGNPKHKANTPITLKLTVRPNPDSKPDPNMSNNYEAKNKNSERNNMMGRAQWPSGMEELDMTWWQFLVFSQLSKIIPSSKTNCTEEVVPV